MEAKTSILVFAPEILGLVTSLISSRDLSHLIMLGSPLLTRKLVQKGGVPSLDLVWSNSPKTTSISLLRLFRHPLRLKIAYSAMESPLSVFSELPNSLTSLEMSETTNGLFSALCGLDFGSILPHLTHLKADIILSKSCILWCSLLPPSLIFLSIGSFFDKCPLPPFLTCLEVVSEVQEGLELIWPPTMREFRWLQGSGDHDHLWNFERSKIFISTLPPTLEALKLPEDIKFLLEEVDILPKRLTSLDVFAIRDAYPKNAFLPSSRLPTSLTTFKLQKLNLKLFLNGLPSSLTCLQLCSMPFQALDHFEVLPQTLRVFTFDKLISDTGNTMWSHELNDQLQLPPKIETFRMASSIVWYWHEMILSIPKTIVNLGLPVIRDGLKIGEASRRRTNRSGEKGLNVPLPRWPSLQSLSVYSLKFPPTILKAFGDKQCPQLRKIEIYFEYSSYHQSLIIPHRIQFLKEIFGLKFPVEADTTMDEVEIDGTALMPPFEHPLSPSFHFSNLLRSLKLDCDSIGDEVWTMVPKSIQKLKTSNSSYFSDYGIRSFIQHFSSLQKLSTGSVVLTGEAFKLLPSSLTMLEASEATLIWDDNIRDLPRSLVDLRIPNAKHLTDACGPLLPPNLSYLEFGKSENITGAFMQYVPRPKWE